MSPVVTIVLGFIALGMVVFLTVRQYQKWRKKKEGKEG